MKKRFSRPSVAALALALALQSVGFAQQPQQPAPDRRRGEARTPGTTPRGTMRDRVRPSANSTAGLEEDFSEAISVIQENYVDGQKLDYNGVFKSSIIGMLRSLDPHSNFYDAKEFEDLQADWRSEYYGIGATISDRRAKGETATYILATFENSPAAKAGLRFGDKIVEVDGQSVIGKVSGEVRDRLRGPRGTSVRVTVERAASLTRETVEITRGAVSQPTVPDSYMIKPGVGYVDMTRGFNRTTGDEFADALDELRKQGMTQLVLDLRGNPGGLLDQAVKVASQFLGRDQVILSQRGRGNQSGGDRVYRSENSRPDTYPLVVLVSRNSASASEIVAGALQDHDRALVIGETTFGKGLVQSIIPLEYGTALTLTSTKYLTPSGRLIQRDYSNEGLYDYYTRGGLGQDENERTAKPAPTPTGPESFTDTGRKVYGGGGIAPDEAIKPRVISVAQQRLIDPVFAFVRELVNGRVAGFEGYKVGRAIEFSHDLKPDEYQVTDNLFKAFKTFVAADESYKLTDAQLDKAREFIARQMRYDIATAAYGTVTATQVLVADDPQVAKAIEVMPRARELALAAQKGRNPNSKSFEE